MRELLYAERYLLVIDDKESNSRVIDLPTCLSDGFRLSALFVHTPICWVKTTWRRQCEICGDPPGKDFLNIRVEKGSRLQRTLGPYDAFSSRKMEELHCNNSDASAAVLSENVPPDCCRRAKIFWGRGWALSIRMDSFLPQANLTCACSANLTRGGRDIDGSQSNCAMRTMYRASGGATLESAFRSVAHPPKDSKLVKAAATDHLDQLLPLLTATKVR
ncbi:unnamed protein product [Toxocara canis]|uniref:Uncharacterized protein n=1 Tax=Toxocara canis TaxID=6265 RepID=A0A183VFZ2_TOXCA|nr:unnamed protein product [Toxocara canis]